MNRKLDTAIGIVIGCAIMAIGTALVPARQKGVTVTVLDPLKMATPFDPQIHDAVATPSHWPGSGFLAIGVTTDGWQTGSVGDAAVIQIDRKSGRVLAQCEPAPEK